MNNLAADPASKSGVREMRALLDKLVYRSAARRDPLWAVRGMTPDFLGHCETPPWPVGEAPGPKG